MPSDASTAPARCAPAVRWLRRAVLSDYFVLGLCVVYAAVVAPFTPGFLSIGNLGNILATLMPLLMVALGLTLVLIVGGIDLSLTATIGLCSIVGAMAINAETGWIGASPLATPLGVLLMLAVGTGVGFANGFAVARLRMPAFMVTLAAMMAISGLAVWLTQSRAINQLPPAFNALGGNPLVTAAITVLAAGAVHVLLSRTLFGRWLYAVGHNPRAALLSGVPVAGVIIATYAAAGLLAAVAAVLYTGQAETGSPVLGQRILLDVIGATVIGGTSLFGGRGKVLWTVFGVLFLKLIDNSLNLLSLSVFAITMIKGGVILLAAFLDTLRSRCAGERS